MESITLGQFAAGIALIVAIIAGVRNLKKSIKEWIETALKERFDTIDKSQKEILSRINDVDLENCKNYLVTYLSEAARGEIKDVTEQQRFWEEYEHYKSIGGNSYIKHRVEELEEKKML